VSSIAIILMLPVPPKRFLRILSNVDYIDSWSWEWVVVEVRMRGVSESFERWMDLPVPEGPVISTGIVFLVSSWIMKA
jgi:hypothetical protein